MNAHPFDRLSPGELHTDDDEPSVECSVCWYVYDPAEGDAASQIPPGTRFSELPGLWCCPCCDAPKERFVVTRS